MTNTEVFNVVNTTLPYPQQIRNLEFNQGYIQFTWRAATYRVSASLFVEEVQGGVLAGTDITIVMRRLFELEANK